MKAGPVIGGIVLGAAGGVLAGTTYFLSGPNQATTPINPWLFGGIAASVGVVSGLLLHQRYPNLSMGLISGGVGMGLLSQSAAGKGVFYFAAMTLYPVKKAISPSTSTTVTP